MRLKDAKVHHSYIALCAILLFGGAAACGRGERTAPPALVAGVDVSSQQLRLGDFGEVQGTEYLFAPLVPGSYSSSYDSDRQNHAKDLLFFHVATKRAHWLLADSSKRLRFYSIIVNPPFSSYWAARTADQRDRETLCVLFESVPDPMREKKADAQASIGLAAPDGTSPAILIEGISGYFGHHLVSEDSLLVFYSRGGELWAADIDPAARSIRSDTRVSTAPAPSP